MTERVQVGSMRVAAVLHSFVEREALPGSGVDPATFWSGLERALTELAPRQRQLLARRDELQASIDDYHQANPGPVDPNAYEEFLRTIGYLVRQPAPFQITTTNVDSEVATQAGPQLVVPILNARFATNAANARWGSLYDALYGSDVIPRSGELAPTGKYNPLRGAKVMERGRQLLDLVASLQDAAHSEVTRYAVDDHGLAAHVGDDVHRLMKGGHLVGYRGPRSSPSAIVLRHHDLHLEVQIDRGHPIGSRDPAGVYDLVLEAAVSTIMDLEDSVAAVDADDKVIGYRNWLRLMQGTLEERVVKSDREFTRSLNPDRRCTSISGETVTLPGRSLLFIRQVGHLMTSGSVVDASNVDIPEGILDAFVTGLASCHDLRRSGGLGNSRAGSIYVVKPKLHGPEEVALSVDTFRYVEETLGLPHATIKVGIMDEERRTSLNLAACIHAARDRIAFINTGFLDRTGDEIHTSMLAGPVVRKSSMKNETWIAAYERANVETGLACGLGGRAQIGKGMWAAPDNLAEMLALKVSHPQSGANTAWVPSPTAATLHALHYHEVDVKARQREIIAGGPRTTLRELLTIPLADSSAWTDEERRAELDNNVQSTLGYVVRWIDAGIGCSKVPDLDGTPLMEDRATCRISSQHVANWLCHGVLTVEDVEDSLRRMASLVDTQNAGDPDYRPMAPSYDGQAFRAARDLLMQGRDQPAGYTEPILHRHRVIQKALYRQRDGA
ncbi:Malate synthase G [metagenome]|uniref:Malate synthase G n=1 Tax=metagenome TaxID=256318 RepID=A0A2P2C3Y4_9ZZZZ